MRVGRCLAVLLAVLVLEVGTASAEGFVRRGTPGGAATAPWPGKVDDGESRRPRMEEEGFVRRGEDWVRALPPPAREPEPGLQIFRFRFRYQEQRNR